jgi:hypothetical protein
MKRSWFFRNKEAHILLNSMTFAFTQPNSLKFLNGEEAHKKGEQNYVT